MRRVTYKGLDFVPHIENDKIEQRIEQLARQIEADSKVDNPLFLCVLNGAFPFASDLFRAVNLHSSEIAFIRLKSYEGTGSTGKIKEIFGLEEDITGRTVIVVEDIVDTGRTISRLVSDLKKRNPAEVKVAALLYKPESDEVGIRPDYVGFEIPSRFIIGFGLDLDGLARNLPDIWVLDEK